MGPPGSGAAARIIIASLAALGLLSCASPGPSLERQTAALAAALAAEPASETGLRVRLAFGADADLDLYVTDPAQETVYFANSPSRSGGALAEDVRCGAPEPRVEVVHFPDPKPGVYRVGVDYPEHCRGGDAPAPWVLVVEQNGVSAQRSGTIDLLHFVPIVVEPRVGVR